MGKRTQANIIDSRRVDVTHDENRGNRETSEVESTTNSSKTLHTQGEGRKPKNIDPPARFYNVEDLTTKRKLSQSHEHQGDNQLDQRSKTNAKRRKIAATESVTTAHIDEAHIKELRQPPHGDVNDYQTNALHRSKEGAQTTKKVSIFSSQVEPEVRNDSAQVLNDDDWKLVCCDDRRVSQFMFQCIICQGWEHALCSRMGFNRIQNGSRFCHNCYNQETMDVYWAKRKQEGTDDILEDVVVCRCGQTDREVCKDKEVIPKLGEPDEAYKQRKAELKKAVKRKQKKDPGYQLREDDYTALIMCNGCGTYVHRLCFGFDGNQCQYHFWLLCERCEKTTTLGPGETYGGLQCECDDNDEEDLETPRVTCKDCKLQFHIKCIEHKYKIPLTHGMEIQCSTCKEHFRDCA